MRKRVVERHLPMYVHLEEKTPKTKSKTGSQWTADSKIYWNFVFAHKSGATRLALARVLGPFGEHCSTFRYICASLCNSFHRSFEYTLRSTWRLNRPTQAKNAQYNLGWACVYILTQEIYREHKKISFDIGTKMHLLEFSTFSWLPSARFSYI